MVNAAQNRELLANLKTKQRTISYNYELMAANRPSRLTIAHTVTTQKTSSLPPHPASISASQRVCV
jgi:hypothetical protein